MKILVVDDEMVSRKKMERIAKDFGECMAVASGVEALTAFQDAWERRTPFTLITLDVAMPELNGTETLTRIRQKEIDAGVPAEQRAKVIMVTSHSDLNTVLESIRAGCDDYIIKPFTPEAVSRKLMKFCTA
jgi:two-component system chemotaxis response regulator CheY